MTREEAIHELSTIFGYGFYNERVDEALNMAIKALKQEPKKGKWIDHREDGYVECPFCHSATNCEDNIDELKFCFSCGARMESDGE